MKTQIYKNALGQLVAETIIPFEGKQVLELSTSRRSSGKLTTNASVRIQTDFGFTFEPFGDFNKTILTGDFKRVTEKVLKEQHVKALTMIDKLKEEAKEFYANKAKKD